MKAFLLWPAALATAVLAGLLSWALHLPRDADTWIWLALFAVPCYGLVAWNYYRGDGR